MQNAKDSWLALPLWHFEKSNSKNPIYGNEKMSHGEATHGSELTSHLIISHLTVTAIILFIVRNENPVVGIVPYRTGYHHTTCRQRYQRSKRIRVASESNRKLPCDTMGKGPHLSFSLCVTNIEWFLRVEGG